MKSAAIVEKTKITKTKKKLEDRTILEECTKKEVEYCIIDDDEIPAKNNQSDNEIITLDKLANASVINLEANDSTIEYKSNVTTHSNNGKTTSDKPIITINFTSKDIFDAYMDGFLEFINDSDDLIVLECKDCQISLAKSGSGNEPSENCQSNDEEDIPRGEKSKKRKRTKSFIDNLYILDASPSLKKEKKPPLYNKNIVSLHKEKKEEEKLIDSNAFCFNCEGDHKLNDCKEPKNNNVINKNRMKYQQIKKNSAKVRYHLEEDQKYAHLKPGKISGKLRHALGLESYQVPGYIYGMRVQGYPPGWLEEAKIDHSELTMFDIDGKQHGKPKANHKNRQVLDTDKLIKYPGFNTPMAHGMTDEFKWYRVPSFSQRFSIENMVKKVNEEFQDNLETCDMDIEDNSNDEMFPPGTEIRHSGKIDRTSPSLNDLESKKLELLAQLNNDNDEVLVCVEEIKICESENSQSQTSSECASDRSPNRTENDEPADIFRTPTKIIKNTSYGTPLLTALSPFSCLPELDNFTKGISPVIHFENLPNSTGKFEQMCDVLDKVRKTLKK